MTLNKQSFFLNLNNNFLFEKNPNIAVAVSGGSDSNALVYLIKEWVKKNNGNVIALLIDHKIREESIDECQFTKKYLNSFKIKSKIISIAKKKVNKKNMFEARNNRFNELIKFCRNNNIMHLFLGHHYDDNLETFLIRRVSGSNFEGLGSIPSSIVRNKINIIRPLLNYTKKQILDFNQINDIQYINDPSNFNTKYTRVVIRNFLKNKHYKKNVTKDFNQIKKNMYFYKLMINQILNKILIKINKKSILISYEDFNNLNKVIREKIIEKIFFYFYDNRTKLRFSKIRVLLAELSKDNPKTFNLASMIVVKNTNLLEFSVKK